MDYWQYPKNRNYRIQYYWVWDETRNVARIVERLQCHTRAVPCDYYYMDGEAIDVQTPLTVPVGLPIEPLNGGK